MGAPSPAEVWPSLPDDALPGAIEQAAAAGSLADAVLGCREWLRRQPDAAEPWAMLADLHAERGEPQRARQARAQAARRGLLLEPVSDDPDVQRFLTLFSGREDAHAVQWFDASRGRGGYSPVREPMTAAGVRAHLDDHVTLGAYLLRRDASVRFFVLDLDLEKPVVAAAGGRPSEVSELSELLDREGRRLLGALGQLGLPATYEDSGHKGRHLWVFLEDALPAAAALELGERFLATHAPRDPRLHLEFFPKQAGLSGQGLGNLVKLPLGVHRVSGRRSQLLLPDGRPDPQPLRTLRRARRVDAAAVLSATEALENRRPRRRPSVAPVVPLRPPEPPFTEADLRADPAIASVLQGCAVLRRLVERALAGDALDHEELVSLEYTLGHLPLGPKAVNLLVARVPGVPAARRLKRQLRGQPASCASVRRKAPGVAARVGCSCAFPPRLPTYPNPLLHRGDDGPARLVVLED